MHKRAERWREILFAIEGYAFVAAKPSGEIVGWATGGPEKTGDVTYTGEISGIYVAPAAQGGGIGRRLMRAARHRLAADGHQAMLLWVLAANLPARRFYETLGGIPLLDMTTECEIGGLTLAELAYGWPDIRTLESKST